MYTGITYTFGMLVYYESFDNPTEAIGREKENQGLAPGEEAAVDPGHEPGLG